MSYIVTKYNMQWSTVGTKSFEWTVFSQENINPTLVQEFLVMYLANQRVSIAHTKTRWEVQWSGRKLYRQKWTGNARVWDARSPIRKKWWVVFWPRNTDNYSKEMPKKMRNKALLSAFLLQLEEWNILWLESYDAKEIKTKVAYDMLQKLPCTNQKTLIVLDSEDDLTKKSLRNIESVTFTTVQRLNAYELLHAKYVVCVWSSLDILDEQFTKHNK